ncbi:MAG: RNA polymerase primary sigma factor [Candidatus Poriferisodalaceae bacterium]|jgi:RNA polymerase primary sigma factor|tara:strand:- start:23722 stop:25431 length:1710 start_codon:yes stop_codon:yes gene_type:complete
MNKSQHFLYRWQLQALASWLRCGRRGIIEAVTGAGKTNVAIQAAADAHRRGLFVLVVVPSRVLMEQWSASLKRALPDCVIGRLGDSFSDRADDCDVLVTTRHSASAKKPLPPGDRDGLIIADECHGFGGATLRKSLIHEYQERLGLTATLERSDDAVEKTLVPYFGGVCYRYDFGQAIADGVCAQPRVAFVAVPLASEERTEYDLTEASLVAARQILRDIPDMPQDPFSAFLAAVSYLSEHDAGPNGKAAKTYLEAFSKRREIVATSRSKYEVLSKFAPIIVDASGTLIFTQTVKAANHAINRLDPLLSIEIITGDTARSERETILTDLRHGKLDAVAAPRVLDEGIDVPDANLGIVVNASRTRRQMIQRMGRILRLKQQGVGARFVVLFASDTLEDPTASERDGFMEEIQAISESSQLFGVGQHDDLGSFLNYFGPDKPIAPVRIGPMNSVTELPKNLDLIDKYAWLSFLGWSEETEDHREIWENDPVRSDVSDDLYLDFEVLQLPQIAREKVSPKKAARLSTGEQPVAMSKVDGNFVLRCTGCGATSEPTPFRWKALEATVECSCLW